MKNEEVLALGQKGMRHVSRRHTQPAPTRYNEVALIKVPFGLAGARNGAELGPDELMTAGLKREITSLGFLLSREVRVDCPSQSAVPAQRKTVKYLNEVRQVSEQVCQEVSAALEERALPLVLGETTV